MTAITQLPDFDGVKGLVIGRFQLASKVTVDMLRLVVANNKQLRGMPIIYGADFGHTETKIVFPIGGMATISADASGAATILIEKH